MTAEMRYFTLGEATDLLPQLTDLVGALRRLRDDAVVKKAQVDLLWQRLEGGEPVLTAIGEGQRELDALSTRLISKAEEIESTGCILRDLEIGLVDFPFRGRADTVFLCWRVGEPAILFWHGTDEGYAGRKPIEQLPLGQA